ncbi:MAG: hypothetical protein NVSMB29_05250 [Candidatus Dormibacteria bacterium]
MSQTPDRETAAHPARSSFDDSHSGNAQGGDHGGEPEEIHLPPNSWVPISVALSLALLFVGFLQARPLNFVLSVVGALWLVVSLVGWYTSARSEYGELH